MYTVHLIIYLKIYIGVNKVTLQERDEVLGVEETMSVLCFLEFEIVDFFCFVFEIGSGIFEYFLIDKDASLVDLLMFELLV